MDPTKSFEIATSAGETKPDTVAVEEPLEIRVFEKAIVTNAYLLAELGALEPPKPSSS